MSCPVWRLVSCCFRADQLQDQREQTTATCVLDLMSTGLLIPVDAPHLTLLPLPTETLCYRHLQQTHSGANGVAHGVSPVLSSSVSTHSSAPCAQPWFDHSAGGPLATGPDPHGAVSQAASADVWGRFRLSPQRLKVQSYT